MKKLYFFILFLLILPLVLSFAQDEEITITTYYPSPFGVYRELRTGRMTIGEDFMPGGADAIDFTNTSTWPNNDGYLLVTHRISVNSRWPQPDVASGPSLFISGDREPGTGGWALGASPFSSATLIGSYFTWNSDNLFFGLRDYGNDRKDSVIMFGDNTNDNLRIQSNTLGTSSSVTGGGLISDLMMVTATGNVGIGTTDIADRLEVAKTGDFSYIRTTVDSSTKDAGIHLRYKEGANPPDQWAILINGPSKGFMINDDYPDSGSTFNPAHRFFIEANTGDVGIGTVTPGTYSGEKVKADIAGYGAVDDIYLKNPKNGSARWASTPLSTSGLFYCTQNGSGYATCYISGQHKACFLAGVDTTEDDKDNYDGCVILGPKESTPMFQRTAVNNTNQWAIVIQCHGSDNYRCWARCLD